MCDKSTRKRVYQVDLPLLQTGIASAFGVLCTYPLDMVKTRLQTQKVGTKGQIVYKSVIDCFWKSYKIHGVVGFYRGVIVNAVLITPDKAINISFNDYFSYKFASNEYQSTLSGDMLAGGLAGIAQSVATTPIDFVKIRLQEADEVAAGVRRARGKLRRFTNITKIIDLINENGIVGVYRGALATVLREATFSILYFPLFNILVDETEYFYYKYYKRDDNIMAYMWYPFFTSLSTACLCSFLVTPLDLIKTRLQYKSFVQYASMRDCIQKTIKKDGYLGFFKGGLCRILSVPPIMAIIHTVYIIQQKEDEFELVDILEEEYNDKLKSENK